MLERVPYPWIQSLYRSFRRELFTRPRPTGRYLVVEPDVNVRAVLGRKSYAPNWEFSYNYRDEDINLAQVVYDNIDGYDVVWWQTHVRGWVHDDGRTWLSGHYEAEPTEHPYEHLNAEHPDNRDGTMNVKQVLLEHNVNVTEEVYDGE